MKVHIWTTFYLILGVLTKIQVQCFQEGICPRKDPPRGVLVLDPGAEVTLHCSGRVSVNGVDVAQTGVAPAERAAGGEGPGVETISANRSQTMEEADLANGTVGISANLSHSMEEADLADGAWGAVNLTGEDGGGGGGAGAGLNGSEVWAGAQNANASGSDGAAEGREAGAQWWVNGRPIARGEDAGDTLRLASLRLSDQGDYSCHRGGRKVFSVGIVVTAPLEQPTLYCYRRTLVNNIRCDWTANQTMTPTPQCYLILKKGLYGPATKQSCSFSPSRGLCWCVLEGTAKEKAPFHATLCLTSVAGNVTSPTVSVHPKNILKPDPPANLTALAEDGKEHRLRVSWKYPRTWSTLFYRLKFELQYFPLLKTQEVQNVSTRRAFHTINDILPRTTYLLHVRAKEEFDLGQWSDWSRPVFARSWTDPEPSASNEIQPYPEKPFDSYMTGSGDWSENELPSGELVSSSSPYPTLTFHLSWVFAACALVTVVGLAVYILRRRKQFMSKLHKLVGGFAPRTPAPPSSQPPRDEGSPLVSPGPPAPSPPPAQQEGEEERGEGVHLDNMGYFLVPTN